MTVDLVEDLLAASSALLTAEEHLLRAGREESALAYDLAATVMCLARNAIELAMVAPGDACQRLSLLLAAVDLDGVESPLASRVVAAPIGCGNI